MHIQPATLSDQAQIKELHLLAFGEEENELVAQLAVELLSEPKVHALVATMDENIVGYAAFSPVRIEEHPDYRGYILGPLAVHPGFQKSGIGSALVNQGLEHLQKEYTDFVLVYGDPEYYGRFDFLVEPAESFIPPFELEHPFGWQVIVWNPAASSPCQVRCVEPLNDPGLW